MVVSVSGWFWILFLSLEKEDSEKDDVSEDHPKKILIPEANTHVFENWEKIPKKSQKESQEDRGDVPEANKPLKDIRLKFPTIGKKSLIAVNGLIDDQS